MDLNQVTLPVSHVEEAASFYKKLGFLQIVDSPHYARFECSSGKSTFSIMLDEGEYKNGSTIYFEDKNLDKTVQNLVRKGIEFDQLPKDMDYLWREAVLHDPSGNKIKIYWAGKNRLDPPWRVEKRE